MRFDSAYLVANTIVSGSFEITGTTVPGDSSSYDLGTASKLWRTVYSSALTGSLTKLANGADYLVAGSGIGLATGSSGQITITSTVAGSSLIGGSDTQVQFNNEGSFGGDANFTFNSTTDTLSVTNISGSLTKLTSGGDYLTAAGNIILTTGSNGSISIATVNSGTIHGVTAGTGLTGGGSSGTVTINLSNTGSAGTYGSASSVPVFTTDAQGRVTDVSPTSIQVTQGQVTNLTSDLSGKASTSTTITGVTGLTGGGDLSANRTLTIDDSVVATISGSTFTGAVKFNGGLSGSLTKLSTGGDYLVAGTGISLTTGSSGNVTIASTAVTSPGGLDSHVQFKDGSTFGGNSGLTYNKITQTLTGTYIVATTGFSGSLTKLSTGGDYLIAGTGIQLSTGSSGAVTIASSVAGSSFVSGLDKQVQFNDGGSFGSSNLFTFDKTTGALTASVVVAPSGFSGSLTKLTDGVTNYLSAGSNVTITTGSNGQVTISSTTSGASVIAGSDTQVQFNDGGNFGADSNLTFNKTTQTLKSTNLSGSLTKLSTGADYLVAGSGITITTGSSGNITIASTVAGSSFVAGSDTQVQFNDGGSFAGNSGLTYNKTTQALTSSIFRATTGFSGSLTKLASGADYLLAGGNLSITTGSSGQITLATVNSGTIHGVTAGTGLTGGGTSGTVALTLSNTGSAGTYGSASTVPVFDTDAQGRVTAVTPTSIQITQGQVTNLTSDLSGKASTSTTITTSPGSGLKGGGDLSTNRSLSIDDSVVATVSGSTFSGAVKFNSGLSGSLTKLSDGVTNYLQAGSGIYIVTQSNGSILITGSSQVSLGGSNTSVQFNDNGALGGDVNFTFNKTTDTLTVTNISGSLTKLSTGGDYLVAGTGIQLSTGSSGAVTITSTVAGSSLVAGSNTQVQFNDGGSFGANGGLTYNKTTQALTGTYVVASTGFSGSLTKLSTGADYLVAGTGIQLSTGSSGNITITSTVAGSSLVAGSNTQVQFNNGGTFGADSNFTFNSTTDTLSVTNISGSLTRLTSGDPYLVGGSGIVVTTGSNGSVTMSLGAVNYATASFTNATNITVNHSVGTTIYDIEVFDTSYNKIIPGIATATSPTQANLTFAIPTSGFVAVGGPTAGGSGASANTLLVTGSSYLVTDVTIPAQGASSSATVTLITFTIPAAGTWDVTYFTNPVSFTTQGYAAGEFALYDSLGNRIADSAVLSIYNPSNIYSAAQNSGRIFLATTGSTSYTLRYTSFSYSQAITVRASTFGRTGVIWSSMGGSTGVTGFGATNFLPLFNTSTALTASNIQVSGTDVNFLTSSIAITNGYGIRLPASGSNTNANTLDCYEEGQATSGMTYTGITVTGGSVVCTATWTKFGRGMFLHVTIGPQSGQAITLASSWQINLSAVTGYPNFYTANSPVSVAAVWVGGNVDQANAWYSGTNRIVYGTNAAMGNSAWTNVGYTMSCFIPF